MLGNSIKNKKSKKHFVVLSILIAFFIAFIWSRSMMPDEISAKESTFVFNILDEIIKFFNLPFNISHSYVRNLAHFSEFFVLGFLTLWDSSILNKKICRNILSCGFICLFVSLIDETIQLYIPGRAGMVEDIITDFIGIICGFILFIIISKLKKIFTKKKG